MAEPEKNPQSDFMMEKIKERPVNKKKLLRRTVTTVAMAVIFGMIACVTFLTLEPVISNLLYPEEKPDAVIFPEEQEEISPEDMLVEDAPTPSIQEAVESVILEDEQIQKILDEIVLDKNNYAQLYNALYEYSTILSEYMVEVTAVSSNEDWLSDTYEKEGKTYGVVIANNGREYLILTDRNTVKQAGGFIIQLMPFAEEEVIARLEENLQNIKSVTAMLEAGHTPEEMLTQILDGMDVEILDTMPVSFYCNCSKERVQKALMGMGRRDLEDIIKDGEGIDVNCHFCNKNYHFTIDELKALLDGQE